MAKDVLIGLLFMVAGLIMVFGRFHFYTSVAGTVLILLAGVFLLKVQVRLLQRAAASANKRRMVGEGHKRKSRHY